MTVKVNRAGEVTREGVKIGTIEKRTLDTFASILGGNGSTVWVPISLTGMELSSGERRQGDAVRMLDKFTTPPECTSMKLGTTYSGETYVEAWVTWEGNSAGVSWFPGSTTATGARAWVVDCFFPRGAIMPTWSNGVATRVTRAHCLLPEQAALADAELERTGLLAKLSQ